MGKFKLFYSLQFITKWKEHYIDYISLNQMIEGVICEFNEISLIKIQNHCLSSFSFKSKDKKNEVSTNEVDDVMNKVKGLKELNEFLSADKGYVIHQMINSLDREIKKVHLHYLNIELELFRTVKQLLIQKKQYSILSLYQLYLESISLKSILDDTTEIMQFLDSNMKCLKRICDKIDKHLTPLFNKGSIALKYLRTKLELPNSDLSYILQYKIIDEISAIIDHLVRKIIKYSTCAYYIEDENKRNNSEILIDGLDSNYSERLNYSKNNDVIINKISYSLEKNQSVSVFHSKDKRKQLDSQLAKIICEINNMLSEINDKPHQFRIKYKNYPITIRYGFKAINYSNLSSGTQLEEDTGQLTHINSLMDEELIIKKFITPTAFKEYILYWKNGYSKHNNQNLILILVHILLSTWVYVISVFNPFYCENLSQLRFFLKTFAFLHFGKIASNFIFGYYLYYKNMFKITVFCSCVLFLIGQNLYAIKQIFTTEISSEFHNILLYISKFIIGIGCGKLLNRKYMITYCSRPLLKETLAKYKLFHNIGLIMGFIVIGFAYLLFDKKRIMYYLNIFSAFFIIVFLVIFLIYFTNPSHYLFSIEREDIETLLSRTLSISKRKTITKEEGKRVQLANNVIHISTKYFNYGNQNIVQDIIQQLVTRQKIKFSYLKKSFCALIFLIFFNSFLPIYSILLFVVFPSKQKKGVFMTLFCFLCSFSYLIHYFFFVRFNCKSSQKWVILVAQVYQVIFGCMIGLIHHDTDVFYCFAILIAFLMILCRCLIEKEIDKLLKKIVPQNFNLFSFNSSLYLTLLESVSIIIASFTIYLVTDWKFTNDNLMDWTELLISIAIVSYPFILSLIITIISYKYLEPKAIAKIYKKNVYQ